MVTLQIATGLRIGDGSRRRSSLIGAPGIVSIWCPQLLGNGKDISQLAFTGQVAPLLLLVLLVYARSGFDRAGLGLLRGFEAVARRETSPERNSNSLPTETIALHVA